MLHITQIKHFYLKLLWTLLRSWVYNYPPSLKRHSWRFSIFFLLLTNLMHRAKPCVYLKHDTSHSSVPQTSVVVQKLSKKHQWVTPPHLVTGSFTTKSFGTLVCPETATKTNNSDFISHWSRFKPNHYDCNPRGKGTQATVWLTDVFQTAFGHYGTEKHNTSDPRCTHNTSK